MSTEEVFAELRRLNRVDKLRAMEILVLDLVAEEGALLRSGTQYEVWSPHDASLAAESLTKLLEQEEKDVQNG